MNQKASRGLIHTLKPRLWAVRATSRTVWLFVELRTADGLQGWGEASDAFGFAGTSREQALRIEAEITAFSELARDQSRRGIAAYLKSGRPRAQSGGLVAATAYSAVEQALWDLAAQRMAVPLSTLLGPRRHLHNELRVYANINRATQPRTPSAFAATACRAVAEGFDSVKLAPFDGFPLRTASASELRRAIDGGVNAVLAVREAVGPSVEVLVDCHGFFSVAEACQVARRLEPARLGWYEEPVPPQQSLETARIGRKISQRMAGGETLFGVAGFAPLCEAGILQVIMPDVKHCGGLREFSRIAEMARTYGVEVSPHNPSGPIATLASAHVAAGISNLGPLELQWGEVPWRGELLDPPERIERGRLQVPTTPGLGARLNPARARRYAL